MACLRILPIGLLVLLIACGSSSESGGSGDTLSAAQSTQAGALVSQVASSISSGISASVNKALGQSKILINCPTSGTLDASSDTLTYDECVSSYDDITITSDGTLSLTTVGAVSTATFDLSVRVVDSGAGTDETMTMIGTVTESSNTNTADLSGTIDGVSYSIDGELTLTGDLLDGSVAMSIDTTDIECTYSSFDTSTATPDDYAAQCVLI